MSMTELDAPPAEATPLPRTRSRVAAVALPAVGVVLTVALWWLATVAFQIQTFLLPAPDDVVAAFARLPGYLLVQAKSTLLLTLLGFAISVACGVGIGLAIAASNTVERMFYPLLVAVNSIPKIALAPLLVAWLGFGAKPVLTMVFLVCFFPIVLSTATGLTTTPTDLAELYRSLDASRWQAFTKVRMPAALPQVFVGLKVAMPLAMIGAVIGEFQSGDSGLGYVIVQSSGIGDTAMAFAAISLLALMSIVLFYGVVLVEHLLLPWVRETTSTR